MQAVVASFPADTSLRSIHEQLTQLAEWTRGGVAPTLDQRATLNFGLLASRYLHDIDGKLASLIYELASFVIYWPAP